ncbi:MAG: type II toxin-antitoxin system RelE/ParE family toxin [Bdellovibrionota bacterium]
MSGFKIVWTEKSVQDLLLIKEYISRDSFERAEAWVQELFDAGESLESLPGRGRVVPEFNKENIKELIIENYRLVYRIKKTSIEILTVFESHRKLKKSDIRK